MLVTLGPLLEHEQLCVRQEAAEIRFEVTEDVRPILGVLKESLAGEGPAVRQGAEQILIRSKSGAKAALPLLIQVPDKADHHECDGVIMPLMELGPEAADAVPKLVEIVSRDSFGGARRAHRLKLKAA